MIAHDGSVSIRSEDEDDSIEATVWTLHSKAKGRISPIVDTSNEKLDEKGMEACWYGVLINIRKSNFGRRKQLVGLKWKSPILKTLIR